jgi:hypothetical protein
VLILALAACGGGGAGAPSGPRAIAFTDVATTHMARHDTGATVYVAASAASQTTLERLVPSALAQPGRVLVAAFQGEQSTGGYAIRITKIELDADRLIVHVALTVPAKDALVTQALTSPAHVVSVASADIASAKMAVLLDASGAQIARTNIT